MKNQKKSDQQTWVKKEESEIHKKTKKRRLKEKFETAQADLRKRQRELSQLQRSHSEGSTARTIGVTINYAISGILSFLAPPVGIPLLAVSAGTHAGMNALLNARHANIDGALKLVQEQQQILTETTEHQKKSDQQTL